MKAKDICNKALAKLGDVKLIGYDSAACSGDFSVELYGSKDENGHLYISGLRYRDKNGKVQHEQGKCLASISREDKDKCAVKFHQLQYEADMLANANEQTSR